ncbi:MAG: hypothetical protein ACOYMA_03410 [Bacteroidia bacterium]
MKKLLLVFLLGLSVFGLSAQSENKNFRTLNLKRGFYFSFEQIKNDSPTLVDSFFIREQTKGEIAMFGGGKFTFRLVPEDKTSFKKFKKQIVGLSDGENFYISDKYTINGWQGMTACILSGPYIIAPVQSDAGQFGGVIGSFIKIGKGYLINLENGSSIQLSKKVLKEILKKYPAISKEYENMDLMDYAIEIIDKINKTEKKD